jgi:hypothetical protein
MILISQVAKRELVRSNLMELVDMVDIIAQLPNMVEI